jgi:ankyrin repeat protein
MFDRLQRLKRAARYGNIAEMQRLLDLGVDVDAHEGPTFWPALFTAASSGNAASVEFLLMVGASTNDGIGTALHAAARQGHCAVIELLVGAGVSPDALTVYGSTPLHWAAGHGHIEAVRTLLELGASTGIVNAGDLTPLQEAERSGHRHIVRLLMDRYSE